MQSLPVKRIEQLGRYWCWAACGEMVGRYFERPFRQCEIVNRCFSAATACQKPSSVDVPVAPARISAELGSWGLHNSRYDRRLAPDEIANEVRSGRPLLALVSLGTGGSISTISHLIVISGYREDTPQRMVYRIDPWFDSGEGWIALGHIDWVMTWAHLYV